MLTVLDKFTRDDYKKILERIPAEGITHANVIYTVSDDKEAPPGWRNICLTEESLSFSVLRKRDKMCSPGSILDFPGIKTDCSNLKEILIETESYQFTIKSTQIHIYGPDMPFTPDDLVSEGVGLDSDSFVYTWRPARRT